MFILVFFSEGLSYVQIGPGIQNFKKISLKNVSKVSTAHNRVGGRFNFYKVQGPIFGSLGQPLGLTGVREVPLNLMPKAFGHCPFSTLGHFILEKSAPNHPGKGLDPQKSSKFIPKKLPQTIRAAKIALLCS